MGNLNPFKERAKLGEKTLNTFYNSLSASYIVFAYRTFFQKVYNQ